MTRFIEGQDRHQVTLLPEYLDDYIDEGKLLKKLRLLCAQRGITLRQLLCDPSAHAMRLASAFT